MHKDFKSEFPAYERSTPKPTMRKYYQLALVIISVVSVVSLLLYRHEYNRLRYVLEVLNFFGKPGQTANVNDCALINITQQGQTGLNFASPLPTWQMISDTHFVYSAFWEKTEYERQVKAISVDVGKSIPKFDCHLWFEDQIEPLQGKFHFALLDSKDGDFKKIKSEKINAYYLYCQLQGSKGVPYGVSFYKTDNLLLSKAFIPIHNIEERTALENSTAICIAPSLNPGLPKSMIVEFLSYHQLIGINDFIIYDKGLPIKIQMVLQNVSVRERFGLNIVVLPWNFPYPSMARHMAIKSAIEKDCLLRAKGQVRNIAVLSWNEYIVPRLHHSLAVMLDHFDAGRKTTARFEIPMVVFCIEFSDDQHTNASSPLILRKTKSKGSGLESPFHVYRPFLMSGSKLLALTTQRVSHGIAAVHRYTQCSRDNAQKLTEEMVSYEPVMLRFAGDLKTSRLLRAWSANRLF